MKLAGSELEKTMLDEISAQEPWALVETLFKHCEALGHGRRTKGH